jgi:hypothetical protein
MRRLIVIVTLVIAAALPRAARAQMSISDLPARGALYVEAFGGSALVLCCSLNLELPVRDDVVIRAGTGRGGDGGRPYDSVLFTAQKLIGSGGRYLEVGGGIVASTIVNPGSTLWLQGPSINIGYRIYSNGWIRRYTFTPILPPFSHAMSRTDGVKPAIGISIGRTFP